MLLFKTYTLGYEFDRQLEHMVRHKGTQSWLAVFLVGEFGTFSRYLCKNDCLVKPDFSNFSNYKHEKYIIFG